MLVMGMLTKRQIQILNLAVSHFIKSAEPVASRTLVKAYRLSVGPATIRNEMADLEEMGYLEQPHTSAGRVPTDRGYREYVDSHGASSLSEAEKNRILELENTYLRVAAEFHQILESALKVLAEVTNLVGVAALPRLDESRFDKIQLLEVGHRKVLVVLVTGSGSVETHVVAVDIDIPQEKLDQISRIFNENFSRSSIRNFIEGYVEVLREIRDEYGAAINAILNSFFSRVSLGGESAHEVLVEGASLMFRQREFGSFERARELVDSTAYREGIARVVSDLAPALDAPSVRIGQENRSRALRDLSLVMCPFSPDEGSSGAIGILGPRRMDYPKVIAIVDHISKLLAKALKRAG